MKYLIIFLFAFSPLMATATESVKRSPAVVEAKEASHFVEVKIKSKTDYEYIVDLGIYLQTGSNDSDLAKAKEAYVAFVTKRAKDFSTHFVLNNRPLIFNEAEKELKKQGFKVDGLSLIRVVYRNGQRDLE